MSFFGVVADLFSEHIGVAQGVYKGSASRPEAPSVCDLSLAIDQLPRIKVYQRTNHHQRELETLLYVLSTTT